MRRRAGRREDFGKRTGVALGVANVEESDLAELELECSEGGRQQGPEARRGDGAQPSGRCAARGPSELGDEAIRDVT